MFGLDSTGMQPRVPPRDLSTLDASVYTHERAHKEMLHVAFTEIHM